MRLNLTAITRLYKKREKRRRIITTITISAAKAVY
jgi:hypothetical protein